MNELIRKLIELLSDELKIYNALVSKAREMHKVIIGNSIDTLQIHTLQYDELSAQCEVLEEKRLLICDTIAKECETPRKHLNVRDIIIFAASESQVTLNKLSSLLKDKINELSHVNTSNQLLLEESLKRISKNVELITMKTKSPSVYGKKGFECRQTIPRRIVNHVI